MQVNVDLLSTKQNKIVVVILSQCRTGYYIACFKLWIVSPGWELVCLCIYSNSFKFYICPGKVFMFPLDPLQYLYVYAIQVCYPFKHLDSQVQFSLEYIRHCMAQSFV